MSEPWPDSYAQLTPIAAQVLRGALILDGLTISSSTIAVTLGLAESEIASSVDELRHAGWLRTGLTDAEELTGSARRWLHDEVATDPAEMAQFAARLADFQTVGLDPARSEDERVSWGIDHRGTVVAAIRANARAGEFDTAVSLAAAAWQVAGRVGDPVWWRSLAREGEEAAIGGSNSVGLIELLSRSAEVFAGSGDRVVAERRWVRALESCHTVGDSDRTIAVLTALAGLYRGWGLLDKAMDALLELLAEHKHVDKPAARAEALAELGSVMLAAGRPSAAESYLSEAADLVEELGAGYGSPAGRARILELRGRALWLIGEHNRARRCFGDALALLVDTDAVAADRLRALVALQPDQALPAN